MLATGQDAPPATPPPTPAPRAFSLALDRLLPQEGAERGTDASLPTRREGGAGFHLDDLKLLTGGSARRAAGDETPSPSSAPLRLHLDTRAFLANLDRGEQNRLRFDVTGAAAQREMARVMYPGLPGLATLTPQVAVGISLRDIIGAIRAAIERARWERLPEGAKVPRTRTLELTILPAVFPCESVVMQPLVLSWVGDAVGGACENNQRCVVAGLPAAAFTALVRGAGAALVAVPEQGNPAPVQLRREGTLQLRPSPRTAVFPVDVRLSERGSHLVVPLHPSLNPQRGEWVTVSNAPLTILLPAGRYRVEMRTADGTTTTLPVTVRADAVEEFSLP